MMPLSERTLATRSPALGYRVKIMYGVGEIANAIKVVTFGLYSLFFATTVLALPGTWIGIVAFVTMFWDAIVDPYIGYLTDGAHASRRHTFMMVGALTMGAGFWAFFSPPPHLSPVMIFAWLLVASFVVRTATSMYTIPYYAVGADLSRDYHERTSVTGIRGMASAVGTLLTASLSFVIFFPEKVPGVDPKLDRSGYAAMGLTFGAVMTIVALIGVWSLRSLRNRPNDSSAPARETPAAFFASMMEALRNRSFRLILICSSLVVMALAVNSSLQIYYLKYYVEINGSKALSSAQAAFFISGLLGLLFWLRISANFDKHRLYIFSAAVTAALMLGGLVLFGKGHALGTGNPTPLFIGYGLTGFFNCVMWFIPQSMVADVADENEWMSGKRNEGALFGVLSFFQQVATGLAIMLSGGLLEHFAGLIPGRQEQSNLVADRIGAVSTLVPAFLFMATAILMLRYKLTRSGVLSIQEELQERHTSGITP